MNGEFNDLTTNNVNVTFNSKPNNTQQSDELTADPNYVRKMGTAYSIGKRVKTSVIVLSSSLIVAGGALSIMANTSFHNAYIGTLPTLSEFRVTHGLNLEYYFEIENKGSLKVYFDVYIVDELKSSIDCSETNTYSGTIEGLPLGKEINYSVYCTNNIDYKKTLTSGSYIAVEQENFYGK